MNVLHITPSTDGYEVVKLLANRHSRTNSFAVIELANGEKHVTGGLLINDTPMIREILDSIPKDKQYEFVKMFKVTPFVNFYYVKE
jgi:hypothetical protein